MPDNRPLEKSLEPHDAHGNIWPSTRYHRLVKSLTQRVGEEVFISVVSFNGAFSKEGCPYRLAGLVAFPNPQAHPHPPKRTYPHMLVLESVKPPGLEDIRWRTGDFHGGAVNLAHVGSITTRAFPQKASEYLYANLDLLAAYYGRSPAALLSERIVPERVCVGSFRPPSTDEASLPPGPLSCGKPPQ